MQWNKNNHVKTTILVVVMFSIISASLIPVSIAKETTGTIQNGEIHIEYRNITVYAPAVGESQNGNIGVISTITVTIENHGSGRVFVDTLPLAQVDMQGSARLAVNVASSFVEKDTNCSTDPSSYDYFFVIRTEAPVIGGPSAGAIMTAAVVSLLENWEMDDKTVMTGMIDPDGSIGPIGGIPEKIDAAHSVGATRFLIPEGQETYTEQVVETVQGIFGPQLVTRQITRNVTDYAMDNYGIEVVEVADIDDVMLYFTGHEIPILPTNNSISTEQYIDSMKPLATTLLQQSTNLLENASDALASNNVPNTYPQYKDQLTEYLDSAQQNIDDSQSWFDKGLYYTSTSKSFQSLINSRFVLYASNYFNASDKKAYLEGLLDQATRYYNSQSSLAKNSEIKGAISLQCVGAAQKRASEASSYLESVNSNIQSNDFFNAIYQIAFAEQRTESIGWWLNLSSYFDEVPGITNNQVQTLAENYIQDAQQSITYTGVILQEIGTTSNLLTSAESMLNSAKDDKNSGFYAASLFEALESLAKANLGLELVDVNTVEKIQSKLDRANQSANAGISESRMLGIEPVLAVSYYEFAASLVNDNVENALFYYKFSDFITGVLTFSNGYTAEQGSRYVGIPSYSTNLWSSSFTKYQDFFVMYAFIGFFGGLAIGILLGVKGWGKYKNKKQQSDIIAWSPHSISPFNQTKTNQTHHSYNSIPKTINDYFKNQNQ